MSSIDQYPIRNGCLYIPNKQPISLASISKIISPTDPSKCEQFDLNGCLHFLTNNNQEYEVSNQTFWTTMALAAKGNNSAISDQVQRIRQLNHEFNCSFRDIYESDYEESDYEESD